MLKVLYRKNMWDDHFVCSSQFVKDCVAFARSFLEKDQKTFKPYRVPQKKRWKQKFDSRTSGFDLM